MKKKKKDIFKAKLLFDISSYLVISQALIIFNISSFEKSSSCLSIIFKSSGFVLITPKEALNDFSFPKNPDILNFSYPTIYLPLLINR